MDILEQYPILGEVLSLIKNNLLGVFFVVSCLFEFSKVKINPITDAMEFLLKPIKKDVKDMKEDIDKKIGEMEKALGQIKSDQDKHRYTTCRWEILTFASAINNGQLFTEQEYQHILEIIDEYEDLHESHGFVNGHTDDAIAKIKTHHDEYKNRSAKYF